MHRHLGQKRKELAKSDPEEVAFWEKLLSMPVECLLEHEPHTITGISTLGHTGSSAGALTLLVQKHSEVNVCILRKVIVEPSPKTVHTLKRAGEFITAFYFPLVPGLEEVRLVNGDSHYASWTPEGSEFRCPPVPLPVILEECHRLPALNLDWDRILALARLKEEHDMSRIDHDFGRDIKLEGTSYRRAVLVHPCIPLISMVWQPLQLEFFFQEGSAQEFTFFIEDWIINTENRNTLQRTNHPLIISSDTFEDYSVAGLAHNGLMGLKELHTPRHLSDVARLLQSTSETAKKSHDLHALRGVKFIKPS